MEDDKSEELGKKFLVMTKDEATVKLLTEWLLLRQEERFLNYEKNRLKSRGDKIQRDIEFKYELGQMEMLILQANLLSAEYEDLLGKFGRKWELRIEEKKKESDEKN